MPIEVYIHAANVLYLLSYLVRKIFVLRFLTIIAGLVLMPYYILYEEGPIWPAIGWGIVFFGVNIYQLIALFRSQRPVRLDPADQEIYEMTFAEFTVKQFADLLRAGEKTNYTQGHEIETAGTVPGKVHVIVNGSASRHGKDAKEELSNGHLFGDLSFITKAPVSSSIITNEPVEAICWENERLNQALASNPELKSAWQGMVSARLAEKLS